jgi:predicted ATPase/DNA-binding SARP family transcriptional activator
VIRFGLLGPVAAWRDSRAVELGSPQQRELFALLLLHRNTVVSTDRMIDVLWPAGPPPNALQVLRTYVSRLRAAGITELATHRQGYELRGEADADRFEALVTEARNELDAAAAEALLAEALSLVRAPPLPELPDDHRAGAERGRLEELRATAQEELVDRRLAQGRHRELVPALQAAVAGEPLRERSWGQLMVALYRCGRQAEALAAYRAAQRVLGELGLATGPPLRELERMILLHDTALEPSGGERLPRYRTTFVGRGGELAAMAVALRERPLVTVVGPAGVGKTRLAVEVAAQVHARPWWVDLGAAGAGRAIAAVAAALAVPQVPGRPAADLIAARLGEGPALLLLDNCEHVADEVARLVERLLEHGVRTLATSREPLRVAGETVHRLAGLPLPEATRLFVDRAAVPESEAVAEVVRRLDGLPLAIELAAGKLAWVSAAELAGDLRERLSLLGDGPRTAPARQRTLEAAIAWSYELLAEEERRVLRRLAVFPGGFDAAAAQTVAAMPAVLPALTRLADASLLVAEPGGEGTRYRLLMTVRAFARERLAEAGEARDAAERHRVAYAVLADRVYDNMAGPGLGTWLPRGRREHENFQAALRWSLDHGDAEAALRLAGALAFYWFRSGLVKDGRELLEQAMHRGDPASPYWPRAALGRAFLAHAAGAPDGLEAADEAVRACRGQELAFAHCWRAWALTIHGRCAEAREDIARSAELATAVGSEEALAFADQLLGNVLLQERDLDGAGDLLVRARDRFRRMRVTLDAGFTLIDLARVRLAQQRAQEVLEVAGDALADFRRREDPRGIGAALALLGHAYALLGERERARPLLDEALALSRRWGFTLPVSGNVDEAPQEPTLGPGVEPLAEQQSAAVVGVAREDRHGEVRVADQLR